MSTHPPPNVHDGSCNTHLIGGSIREKVVSANICEDGVGQHAEDTNGERSDEGNESCLRLRGDERELVAEEVHERELKGKETLQPSEDAVSMRVHPVACLVVRARHAGGHAGDILACTIAIITNGFLPCLEASTLTG